jgi:secreted Zn-dependent insulinase-like peptidase
MNRILLQVAAPELTEQRFEIARQQLIDGLQNKAKDRPVEQTSEFIQTSLIEGAWPTDAKLRAAREVSFEELQSFSEALLSQVDPVMMAHGNLTEASTLNLARQIDAIVLGNSELVRVARSQVRQLPDNETLVSIDVDHPDTGYTLYMQGDNTSFEERARFRLLAQIISSPFYEEIRTNRQMGYIVYATPFEMLETPALGFVVQSPSASPAEIDQAVQEFSNSFEETLSALTAERLDREKQAVISKLLERDRQLGEISSRYWREIDRGMDTFDSRQQLANSIKQVGKPQLLETFRKAVLERKQALEVVTGGNGLEANRALGRLTELPPVPAS